jgi:hypothetical protein
LKTTIPVVKRMGNDLSVELEAIEQRRLAALCAADMEVCDELHASDDQLVTPGGVTLTRTSTLGLVAGDPHSRLREPSPRSACL